MFMISAIIILLGGISVTRLPVDLLPDVTYPTVSVFVRYPGVGPQEIEQLITRPLEQTVSAVAGLDQLNSQSSEGISRVSLSFAWGTDLNEAMDDMRMRLDRVRGRLPLEAEPMQIFRQDSNAMPIMSLGIEGNYDRVTLREMAENQIGPRLERAEGVAAVTTMGGLRRQIHVQLSKEKIAALDLPVDRISALLRSENTNTPLGEVNQGERTYLLRSQAQFQSLDEIRNLVLMTRGGVPIYVRDVAEVVDTTEDVRSLLRINGLPGVRLSVQKQSGTNTVQVAQGIRDEIARINAEMPNIKLNVLDDSSVYISRSIHSVQEHALIGSALVTLIIFLFLRSFRSTLIVCTSIPISVVGTFALLYFAGYTLNIMTFGGLALGIGMVVDAAIVVLENAYRHMEHGKDRVTAAIEGSEEVWGAIVASILTHIAVFVPLLFLTGISSILFKQLSVVVIFSLLMSLLVAVTLVPVLCANLLVLPPPVEERKGLGGRIFTASERFLEGMDDAYRRFLHKALVHRPIVLGIGAASVIAAVLMFPLLNTELAPQTDEGVVQVSAELAAGTRIERTDAIMSRLEQMTQQLVPEAETLIASAGAGGGGGGGGGMGGGGTSRGFIQLFLVPKDQRTRSSDQIAFELRRQLSGIPGVIVRANASGGNNQLNRLMSGGQGNDSRMGIEIRGEDLEAGRKLALEVQDLLQTTPGIADPRLARDEARPELAVQIDRPKAALFGLNTTQVANTIRTNVAGTVAAQYPPGRLRVSDHRSAEAGRSRAGVGRQRRHGQHGQRRGLACQKRHGHSVAARAEPDRTKKSGAHGDGQRRAGDSTQPGCQGRHGAPSRDQPSAGLLHRLWRRSRAAGKNVQGAAPRADPGAYPRLRGHGIAVRVAARSVHHHVLGSDGGHRRRAGALSDEHVVQPAGLPRGHHARRHRRQQCDPAGRLHEHPPSPRRDGIARGGRGGRTHATAADPDDLSGMYARHGPNGPRHRRRQRAAGSSGACRHRRAADLDLHHTGLRSHGLHALRGGMEGTLEEAPAPRGRRPLSPAVTEVSQGRAKQP